MFYNGIDNVNSMSRKKDNSKIFAVVISSITNPIIVVLFALIAGNYQLIISEPKIAAMFFFLNLSLPIIFYIKVFVESKRELLDQSPITRNERYLIYLGAIFSTLISTILFAFTMQNYHWVLTSMLFCVLFSAYYLINRYIDKISLHSGAFAFTMIYLSDRVSLVFVALLALLPLIFWARVKLHRHTWFQLLLGSSVGMFIGILSWTF